MALEPRVEPEDMLQREELQPTKENKEIAIKKKEEDPILIFEEIPSFVEEKEEEKVVPSLVEQIMAFEPLQVMRICCKLSRKEIINCIRQSSMMWRIKKRDSRIALSLRRNILICMRLPLNLCILLQL